MAEHEEKIKFNIENEILPTPLVMPRYRKLKRLSIIITSLVALIPLFIVTLLNYYQDQEAYHAETRYTISRLLSNTQKTLEYAIKERRSALSLIIHERTYEELNSQESLKTALSNLKESFGGFVDIGLIESSGLQTHYLGPYDLRGKNYQEQDWFKEILVRNVFVSDVFMGHRNIPHFVIAFKHEKPNGDFYVIRTTIDMDLLYRLIYDLDLDKNTDAFIINREGLLQTPSLFYGNILDKVKISVPEHFRQREVIDEYHEDGMWLTTGYVYIEESPFILVVIKQRENPFFHWFYRRTGLIWFLLLSAGLILAVVIYGSTHTVKRLRELDKRRVKIFHNMEYTNKMATIGRMAAGVAHEINNPLAIINEKAGLLKDLVLHTENCPNQDKFLKLADSITGSVERCSKVTHRLLGFAKRMEDNIEMVDLKSLLEEVVGFQNTEIAHRNLKVNFAFDGNLPTIESDRGQLQQVFLNIINNAFAAVDDGGQIDISTAPCADREVAVTITDNGSGIPEENLQNIFEPFYSTKGQFGTGLGLSITRDIIDKLGGKIEVESQIGKGTSFIVKLPCHSKRVAFQEKI
ncbi:MAG: two-component sensor histidine kinase [candidate division Zixibacteria bacterium]|nr:two-component sensor histidine kinase [candidate division Zixibacteria bacterium]